MSIKENRRATLNAAADLAMTFREFVTLARTVSHIQPHISALPTTAIKVLGMGDSEIFIKRNGLVDIVFPEDESQGGAYFAEFGKALSDESGTAKWGLSGYRRCTSQLASEVLRRIIKQQVEGVQSIQVDCVVVATSFDDQFSSYYSLLRVLDEGTGLAATQGATQYSLDMDFRRLVGREFLYAYVRDDWLRVVGMEEPTRPATYVGTIGVHINGREPFLLNVARIAGFAGTLLKAYPMHAASVIEDYYRKCFEKGYLRQLSEEPNGGTQLEHCRRAFVAITRFWQQL
jgi:hypothetical protein